MLEAAVLPRPSAREIPFDLRKTNIDAATKHLLKTGISIGQ